MNYNNPSLRILNIHHYDLAGFASHIVLKNFYNTVISVPVTYNTEWKLVEEVDQYKDKYDAIICTDFYPSKTFNDLWARAHVQVIDHHETVEEKNNDNNVIINTQFCATALTYKFISAFKDIKYLEPFVRLVDDWDMFRLRDARSPYFNNLFWEMGGKWFIRRFMKGNLEFYPEEKQYFIDAKYEFKQMYESLEIVDLCRNGVFFEASKYQHECMEALKKDGYKWFIVKNKNNLSIRCDDLNLADICARLGKGGGHVHAAGIPLTKMDNVDEVVSKIEQCIDADYANLENG